MRHSDGGSGVRHYCRCDYVTNELWRLEFITCNGLRRTGFQRLHLGQNDVHEQYVRGFWRYGRERLGASCFGEHLHAGCAQSVAWPSVCNFCISWRSLPQHSFEINVRTQRVPQEPVSRVENRSIVCRSTVGHHDYIRETQHALKLSAYSAHIPTQNPPTVRRSARRLTGSY